MTENEKARELIATSETTVKVDPQNGWYLKRFAALQFEGSVDNFSTNMPIHVLEQQLPKDDTMKLDDAVIEGQDFDYSKFYDERGNEYSSVSELVQTLLDLDDDESIQEYNEENPAVTANSAQGDALPIITSTYSEAKTPETVATPESSIHEMISTPETAQLQPAA